MPSKHRPRPVHPAPPPPPATGEAPVRRWSRDHANLGPDDRVSPRSDDIEGDGSARVPDVDASVIEGGASDPDLH